MREAASRGFWMTTYAPYGYKRVHVQDGAAKRPKLELNPPADAVARRIYTVKVLADSDGPQFYLTLDKALPVGFTLQVGATTLSSQDASIREYSSGATQYGWANQGVILADVDTVEVSLTLAE